MSANETGWLLALLWGALTDAMLIVGGVQENLALVLSAILPGAISILCMWWAEENA